MLEERKLYLEKHPTKGNGYYTRDLLTLFGPLEDHKVPRVREGDFHPKLLPYRRRTSIELSEAILALYASGASTRDISRDSVRGVLLPKRASLLTQVVEDEVKEESPTCAGVPRHLPRRHLPFGEAREGSQGAGVPRIGDQAGRPQGDLRVLAVRGGRGVGHQPLLEVAALCVAHGEGHLGQNLLQDAST